MCLGGLFNQLLNHAHTGEDLASLSHPNQPKSAAPVHQLSVRRRAMADASGEGGDRQQPGAGRDAAARRAAAKKKPTEVFGACAARCCKRVADADCCLCTFAAQGTKTC